MKYLKTYEQNIETDIYWKIKMISQEYVSAALNKIGLTHNDQIFRDILYDFNQIENYKFKPDLFYIMKGKNEEYWYNSVDLYKFKCKYMGEVKVSKMELDLKKYNL